MRRCQMGECRLQRPLSPDPDFAPYRIVVMQIERDQKRFERESLNHERAEYDGERGQHNQIAKRKTSRQRKRRRECDNAPHPRP